MIQDIDKTKQALEDGLEVTKDVKKALADDGEISFIEGSSLVIKHGGKALRLIGTVQEIGQEIINLDGGEAEELVSIIAEEFGGNTEAIEAIKDIAEGAGKLNQGIQKLIDLKNKE